MCYICNNNNNKNRGEVEKKDGGKKGESKDCCGSSAQGMLCVPNKEEHKLVCCVVSDVPNLSSAHLVVDQIVDF